MGKWIEKMDKVAKSQSDYYGRLFKKHGYSPAAVASVKQIYKNLRYSKLSGIFKNDKDFSIHDIGMGLGHYYEYLKKNFLDRKIVYSGSEVVKKFVDFCENKYPANMFYYRDISAKKYKEKYDYLIFAGTFYHPYNNTKAEWEKFMFRIISNAFKMAKKGVAFNCITEFCDYYDHDLYYCNISKLVKFINNNLSRFFTIEHDYALYEFTVFVYNSNFIKNKYPEIEYQKYFKRKLK